MPIPMRVENCLCGSEAIEAFLRECRRVEQDKYLKTAETLLEIESGFSEAIETDMVKSDAIYQEYCRSHVPDEFVMELLRTTRPEIPAKIEMHLDKHYHQCRRELMQKIEAAVGSIVDIHGLQLGKDGLLTGMVDGEDGRAFVTTTYIKNEFQPFRIEVRKM